MANDYFQQQLFQRQPMYGDRSQEAQLLKEAPISGAPAVPPPGGPIQPGQGASILQKATGTPQPAQAQPQQPGPQGHEPPPYYAAVAAVWTKLARMKGASPEVRAFAQMARQYAQRVERGEV